MRSVVTGVVLLGLMSIAGWARAEDKPRLGVLLMESRGSPLKADEVVGLTDLLAAEMAKSERYLVMPRDELRRRLVKRKGKGRKPLGPPPDKVLESGIYRVGKQCLVLARIYDVSTAVMETAALQRGPCAADALLKEVPVTARTLLGARVDPAAPVTAVYLMRSMGTGLSADEVVSLTNMMETVVVAERGARLEPRNKMRKMIAALSGKTEEAPARARYGVSCKVGRVGKFCLATAQLTDLHTSGMVKALPGRSRCDPGDLLHSVTSLSQDLAEALKALNASATGKKSEPPAPTSPIKLPPRPASPASGR